MNALLSFESAPPLSVPARFFVSAPWYGVLAGLLVLVEGDKLFVSRWSPAMLALTHLLTVGVLMQVMVGALFQFMPVAADAGISRPLRIAAIVHGGLNLGALALAGGFYFSLMGLLKLAALALGTAIMVFVVAALHALLRKPHTSPTIPALKLALLGLLVTLALGLHLLAVYAFGLAGRADLLTAQHAAWGLIGWSATLVIGVAYVVVPMFQLTPGYSRRLMRTLVPLLFSLLLAWSAVLAAGSSLGVALVGSVLAVALGVFATVTLGLQGKSRRAEADTTILFWRFAMLCALLATALWAAQPGLDRLAPDRSAPLVIALGLLAVFGVLVSVVSGMLYKILPFLCWLNLQQTGMANGIYKTPHMGIFLAEQPMRLQFFLHNATLALLLGGIALPVLLFAAGGGMIASFALLGRNLAAALRVAGRERTAMLSGIAEPVRC